MLKGLPASGKSTYAKELVNKYDYYRVNKDDLRAMVNNSHWSKEREKFIVHWRDEIVKDSLGGLKNVVVDDTNFAPIHETVLRTIAKAYGAEFEVKFFDVPVEECIKRDLLRPRSVGEKVIRKMYDEYLKPKPVVYVPPAGKPRAIIVDIDGTLAHMNGRSPYDYTKVSTDVVDATVRDLVNSLSKEFKVLVVSGRDDTCFEDTAKWLRDNNIAHDDLLMRDSTRVKENGGKVADTVIKREIFDESIKDHYQIEFVLDDRNQVVDMWRNELGLKVLQVAEGDF